MSACLSLVSISGIKQEQLAVIPLPYASDRQEKPILGKASRAKTAANVDCIYILPVTTLNCHLFKQSPIQTGTKKENILSSSYC